MMFYITLRTDFEGLEMALNSIAIRYPGYHLYQIIPEHCFNGCLFVIILKRNKI